MPSLPSFFAFLAAAPRSTMLAAPEPHSCSAHIPDLPPLPPAAHCTRASRSCLLSRDGDRAQAGDRGGARGPGREERNGAAEAEPEPETEAEASGCQGACGGCGSRVAGDGGRVWRRALGWVGCGYGCRGWVARRAPG
uniref:Uncharacterized protein n=1 Tax=Arundo donax TaxID=35708 RepID=A0A0A8ZSI7_ARUDO